MLRDAVVVGVNTYQNLPGLKAPARDAEAVAQMLQTCGEFRVHRLPEIIQSGQPQVGQKTQVSLQMLEAALIQLFKPKGRSVPQTALFYFSGHGLQREAGIREGFLAPSNADPDRGFYGLSLFWLRRLLQESPVRQRIIILDCCHSGELLNFLEADPGATPGTDRLLMAASREYETAYESIDSPYSVFTQALLTGLDPCRSATGIVNHHALIDWVNQQLKGEIQQPLFESSGSEIILTRLSPTAENADQPTLRPHYSTTPIAQSAARSICPYRGLECFEEPHAQFFFGRESLVADLLKQLKTNPLLAIVGASGCGKSSLVRAGLIPQLRQSGQDFLETAWQIRLLTPGTQPLKSLAAAFVDPEASAIDRAEQLGRAEQLLQSGGAGFVQLVRASLPATVGTTGLLPKTRSSILLVIDQFEEVFTQSSTAAEIEQLILCLSEAWQSLTDCLKVVIVLRADFVGRCRQYEDLAAQMAQHAIIVPPLNYEQLKAAIVRPAQQVGIRCEPNLVYTLLMDSMSAPGELSLLQSILLELWQRRQTTPEGIPCLTLDSYRELGGIRQFLPQRATAVFDRFNRAEQAIAQRIFLALTQFGEGTEDTRRRVLKSHLVGPAFASEQTELVERILEKLVSAKLLITDQAEQNVPPPYSPADRPTKAAALRDRRFSGRGNSTANQTAAVEKPAQAVVDVAHEALIRHWSLLRQWCDADREVLRHLRRLEEAAYLWHTAGQPASIEYLLTGLRLQEAEQLLTRRAQAFSALMQEYVIASRQAAKRLQRQSCQIKIAVPVCLATMLAIVAGHSYRTVQTQTTALSVQSSLKPQQIWQRFAQMTVQMTVQQDSFAIAQPDSPLSRSIAASSAQSADRQPIQLPAASLAQSGWTTAIGHLQPDKALPLSPLSPLMKLPLSAVAVSPDSQWLAVAAVNGTIVLHQQQPDQTFGARYQIANWQIDQRSPLQSVPQSQFSRVIPASAASIPQTANPLAAAAEIDRPIDRPKPIRLHQLSFSPNSQLLLGVGDDRTVRLWRVASGRLVQIWRSDRAALQQVKFSPDGTRIIVVREDSSVQTWQVDQTPGKI